jgi:hypothetical protein
VQELPDGVCGGGGERVRLGRPGRREPGQHALLGGGAAAAVVDAVAGRHHDQQRADVELRELPAEEGGVLRRLAEEGGDR